ncbi:F0F1 ATP synthase subunit epsilon [Ligilactobacillus apodemi]|uniref:ATP synthase epsilon chain n=1 Tax=Ligilactobacillus apodemi DSM 16634 = JCM 16172 TaxID=1423724 RepID=A0A0R1TS48_9LACO|nr:F0F1 ATP synthase subunit epsilon [Ligilactobacillus apodemi]KRL84205.1 ATP synthase epsilon chain [Ligilactobacillus apodemi DSM 16634 = JCM 16172]MBD5069904.1 F0F1 ATP synthase subunit epsilon [Lactobacillus sp.]MCR1901250.1 F0F1 ATP synthase subunit epsilon [Ligilactobacillus apodemi]
MDEKPVLTVNVVTPDGPVYENTTDLVICKTTVGEVGIMPNRLPLLASLAIDEIRVKTGEDTFDEVAVSGGFIEFSNNVLSVVASAAERKEEIDTSRAERARKRAEARIAKAKEQKDDNELRRAEVSLRRAINRLSISNKK